MKTLVINGKKLSIAEVISVSRNQRRVEIDEKVIPKIAESREMIEKIIARDETVYGVTTGLGNLSNIKISKNQTKQLQMNTIRSHSVGVGRPLDPEIVRAIILLRLNSLIQGNSGVRLIVLKTLLAMLNKNVLPVIPEKGSVGASGDLAPLSHMCLPLIGEGEAYYKNQLLSGSKAMQMANIKPISLHAKEGLALINGTQVIASIGCHVLHDAANLFKHADIAAALSLEAFRGTPVAYDPRIHKLRPHPGQIKTASNLLKLISRSQIRNSYLNRERVQDCYSFRCVPQVHGPSKETLRYSETVMEREINSVTDNPLIFASDHEILSGGNFHGQVLALIMDFMKIALAEIGNISERRIEKLNNSTHSKLPPFLVKKSGLNSGMMIIQYTAAALVSENKVLAHPASVDSIPTSAEKEDHVSMGTIAARQAKEILHNVEHVIAIELLCGAQGIDLLAPLKPGKGTQIAHEIIRQKIPALKNDRTLAPDINEVVNLIRSRRIVTAIEKEIGALEI